MRARAVNASFLGSIAILGSCRASERPHRGDDEVRPDDGTTLVDTSATLETGSTGAQTPGGFHGLWVHNDNVACALASTGAVACWGDGAAAIPVEARSGTWLSFAVFDGVRDPAWGCGLRPDGEVECWGCGGAGYGGWCDAPEGTWDQLFATDELGFCASAGGAPLTCWGYRALVDQTPDVALTGIDLPCGVDVAGAPVCWAVPADARQAMTLDGPFRAVRITLANAWCGITPDDRLVCEQLREDQPGAYVMGLPTDPPATARDADLRGGALCAILPDRTLQCAVNEYVTPDLLVVPEGAYSEVQIGGSVACAIAEDDGSIACWGDPTSSLLRGIPEL